jgi:hypothetical protein
VIRVCFKERENCFCVSDKVKAQGGNRVYR